MCGYGGFWEVVVVVVVDGDGNFEVGRHPRARDKLGTRAVWGLIGGIALSFYPRFSQPHSVIRQVPQVQLRFKTIVLQISRG